MGGLLQRLLGDRIRLPRRPAIILFRKADHGIVIKNTSTQQQRDSGLRHSLSVTVRRVHDRNASLAGDCPTPEICDVMKSVGLAVIDQELGRARQDGEVAAPG